jgi:predicted glycosyltransferase
MLTPKQILFFTPLIQHLEQQGHKVIATSRRYREVNLISVKKGLDLKFAGRHGGASLQEKIKASCERISELTDLVGDIDLDCAVSFSSPECARTAFGLGVKHVCVSDSPHAEKVCRLSIPLSDLLLTPWVIPYSSWSRYGIQEEQVIKYRALDPAVWLKRRQNTVAHKEDFGLDPSKKTITLRLDEIQAAYLLSSDRSFSTRLLNALLQQFSDCEVFVLGRYQSQIETFKKSYSAKAKIAENVVDGADLISASDIFIGLGGTMTSEAALLGVPAISLFQGGSLYTEDYLVKEGLLMRPRSIEETINTVKTFLQNHEILHNLQKKAQAVLNGMEDPVTVIADAVEKATAT